MGAAEGSFDFDLELKKRSSVATISDKNSYTFNWIPKIVKTYCARLRAPRTASAEEAYPFVHSGVNLKKESWFTNFRFFARWGLCPPPPKKKKLSGKSEPPLPPPPTSAPQKPSSSPLARSSRSCLASCDGLHLQRHSHAAISAANSCKTQNYMFSLTPGGFFFAWWGLLFARWGLYFSNLSL